MIKHYFKLAWNLMKQERLFSAIYIVGTGLAVSMVMGLAIVLVSLLTNVYPETNRDRMLIVNHAMVNYPNGNIRMALLSEQTAHACFDGMNDVEALSLVFGDDVWNQVQQSQSGNQDAMMKLVDVDFWKVFNFQFLKGKPFTEADFQSGLHVTVVSESLARSVFGTTDVVGKEFMFAFRNYRICGVVKDVSPISSMSYAQLWTPYTAKEGYKPDTCWEETGSLGDFNVYMLVREGADICAVKHDGQERIRRYSQTLKEGHTFSCMGRPDTFVENFFHSRNSLPVDFTKVYIVLALLVLVLLLVPAVNLSGMTESRMERRLAELGVRRSFGAPSRVLIKQVITENLLFTLLGGIVGLFLSYMWIGFMGDWLFKLLLGWNFPGGSISLQADFFVNFPLFIIVLLVCFLLNFLSAIIPAWRASRRPIVDALHPLVGVNLIAGNGMSMLQRLSKNAWIGIELMLVFGLLWGMTDFFLIRIHNQFIPVCRNIEKVWNVEIGSLPEHHSNYNPEIDTPKQRLADYRRIVHGLRQEKEVEEVAVLSGFGMPFSENFAGNVYRSIKDTTKLANGEMIMIDTETDFFRVFGYTTAEGKPVSVKDFDWADPKSMVVGQRTADALFPDGNAVNQFVQGGFFKNELNRIIGIVGDVNRFDYNRLEHTYYTPFTLTENDLGKMSIAIRLKPEISEKRFAEEFEPRIRKSLQYGNFYVKEVKSFKQIKRETADSFGIPNQNALGITLFAFFFVNILLCVMGTFWYRVQMRREEIGVRMAMGADKQDIKRMLFKEGLVLLTVVAVPAMFVELQLVLTDVISYGLYEGAQPEYWLDYPVLRFLFTNLITWLILAVGIILAISIPAYRVVKITPADALRDE